MRYATLVDLQARFGEAELRERTDPDALTINEAAVERALDDAHADADGALALVYALPLAGCTKPAPVPGNPSAVEYVVPPQLMRICCDVARYYLHDNLAPEHEVYLRFKGAERELQAIAEGKTVLSCPWGGQPGLQLAGDAPGDAEVFSSFSPRSITDDGLRGFA